MCAIICVHRRRRVLCVRVHLYCPVHVHVVIVGVRMSDVLFVCPRETIPFWFSHWCARSPQSACGKTSLHHTRLLPQAAVGMSAQTCMQCTHIRNVGYAGCATLAISSRRDKGDALVVQHEHPLQKSSLLSTSQRVVQHRFRCE